MPPGQKSKLFVWAKHLIFDPLLACLLTFNCMKSCLITAYISVQPLVGFYNNRKINAPNRNQKVTVGTSKKANFFQHFFTT